MAKANSLSEILSLPKILSAPKPRETVMGELIKLLKTRLKELKIVWNPEAFIKGLSNPELPVELIKKLEGLISLAEVSDWKLSPSAKLELDETVEDIESFNPSYRARAKKEREKLEKELKAGTLKTYSLEELEQKFKFSK